MPNHKKVCTHALVKCRFEKCSATMNRQEQHEHENQCKFRPVKCSDCGEFVTNYRLALHKSSLCSKRTVYCTECGIQMISFHLEEHLKMICENRAIECLQCGDYYIAKMSNEHKTNCSIPTQIPQLTPNLTIQNAVKRILEDREQSSSLARKKQKASCTCVSSQCRTTRCGCLFGCNSTCLCQKTTPSICQNPKNTNTL